MLRVLRAGAERRRPQRVEAAADGETGGKKEGEDQKLYARLLRAQLGCEHLPGVVQAPGDGADGQREEARDVLHGHVHEIVQQKRLADVRRKALDHVAQKRRIDLAQKSGIGVRIGRDVGHHLRRDDRFVGFPVLLPSVEMDHDPGHPAEEGGLLGVAVDAADDLGEGAVHELLGVPLVGAEPTGERQKAGLVFDLKAAGSVFRIDSELFDQVHGSAGGTPTLP